MTAPLIPAAQVDEEQLANANAAAAKAMEELEHNRQAGLLEIAEYLKGNHPGPYVPKNADDEYRTLAKRSIINWVLLVSKLAGESLYCENHRLSGQSQPSPAWLGGWQRNRMDARQTQLYRGALDFSTSYAAVDRDPGRNPYRSGLARVRLFSALNTSSLWEDPVNDERPAFALHIRKFADGDKEGECLAWDRDNEYTGTYKGGSKGYEFSLSGKSHGCTDTPIIAYAPYRDLLGQTSGIAAPLLGANDKFNQINFDLVVVLSYGAFKVRYVTGMVPPPKQFKVSVTYAQALAQGMLDPAEADRLEQAGTQPTDIVSEQWVQAFDEDGNPIRDPIQMTPKSLVVIKEPGAHAGSFDATDPKGYIEAKADARSDLASLAQIPNHWVTGNIANLAADALAVAEGPWWRMIREFQKQFGESHEMLLQLIAEVDGLEGADDFGTEVSWSDMRDRSVAQIVDALGKGRQMLDIPRKAAWGLWPNMTGGEMARWEELREEEIQNHEAGPEASFNQAFSGDSKAWASSSPVTEDDEPR